MMMRVINMEVQRLHNVFCPICQREGRGNQNQFTLIDAVNVDYSTTEEEGQAIYRSLKAAKVIIECSSCVASEFNFPAV